MKVAIIIAGHMRCWKQMFPYFKKNFIDKYNNPDIFISTWSDEGWWKWGNIHEASVSVSKEELIDYYKPKDIKFDDYNLYDPHFSQRAEKYIHRIGWPKNVISMTYRWLDGCRILEHYAVTNNVHYDLIIRTRTDLEVIGDLPDFDPKNFYIIYNHYEQGGHNDVIHVGNKRDIFAINTMYNRLDELYEKEGRFCPHLFARRIVDEDKIPLISLPNPYRIWNTPWGQHQDVDRHITK
jgi:hypothetical protein